MANPDRTFHQRARNFPPAPSRARLTEATESERAALARRVAKRVDDDDCNWYFYDGLQVIAEGKDTDDRTTYTVAPSAIGGIICRECGIGILPMNTGGTPVPRWYLYARLGNVMGVTDENGDVHTLYTMEAFGTVLEMTNGGDFSNEPPTDVQPYHVTTKERDAHSQLYYFNARWYDWDTGRFLSRDPIPQLNDFTYCPSEPNCVDPDGMKAWVGCLETTIWDKEDKKWRPRKGGWEDDLVPYLDIAVGWPCAWPRGSFLLVWCKDCEDGHKRADDLFFWGRVADHDRDLKKPWTGRHWPKKASSADQYFEIVLPRCTGKWAFAWTCECCYVTNVTGLFLRWVITNAKGPHPWHI